MGMQAKKSQSCNFVWPLSALNFPCPEGKLDSTEHVVNRKTPEDDVVRPDGAQLQADKARNFRCDIFMPLEPRDRSHRERDVEELVNEERRTEENTNDPKLSIREELAIRIDAELEGKASALFEDPWAGHARVRFLWEQTLREASSKEFRSIVELQSKKVARPISFDVLLTKAEDTSFGFAIQMPKQYEDILIIDEIQEGGALDSWNLLMRKGNQLRRCVHPFAVIVSVNGIAGDQEAMAEGLRNQSVKMMVVNPPSLSELFSLYDLVRGMETTPTAFWSSSIALLDFRSFKSTPVALNKQQLQQSIQQTVNPAQQSDQQQDQPNTVQATKQSLVQQPTTDASSSGAASLAAAGGPLAASIKPKIQKDSIGKSNQNQQGRAQCIRTDRQCGGFSIFGTHLSS